MILPNPPRLGPINNDIVETKHLREINQKLVTLMAHELSAPLTHIVAYLRLWQETSAVAERVELNFVVEQALALKQRLDDLLLLDQLEAGLWRLQREPIFVQEIITRVLDTQRWRLDEKEIALSAHIVCNRLVMADKEMLFRALEELVINACKFSPTHSRARIRVDCADGLCVMAVSDEGSGLSPEKQTLVFQPLFESGANSTGRFNNLGVGLKLVRAIADKHNGWVSVDSQVGRGSTFTLAIPLA